LGSSVNDSEGSEKRRNMEDEQEKKRSWKKLKIFSSPIALGGGGIIKGQDGGRIDSNKGKIVGG